MEFVVRTMNQNRGKAARVFYLNIMLTKWAGHQVNHETGTTVAVCSVSTSTAQCMLNLTLMCTQDLIWIKRKSWHYHDYRKKWKTRGKWCHASGSAPSLAASERPFSLCDGPYNRIFFPSVSSPQTRQAWNVPYPSLQDCCTVSTSTKIQNKLSFSGEIIWGTESKPHSRPYMASLMFYYGNSYRHYCGGFLVAKDIVMTAAHCNGR